MNRGRQRGEKVQSVAPEGSVGASIDLGLSLSVYGKDAEGRLIEIGKGQPAWYGFTVDETWPTEQ